MDMDKSLLKYLKVVDLIFEVTDARCPNTARSPQVQSLIRDKRSILILNKTDLADTRLTKEWVDFYAAKGEQALPVSTLRRKGFGAVKRMLLKDASDLNKRLQKKGRRNRDLRVAVLGIPNTGKSSFLNSLLGKRAVKSGDRPGVTRGPQWVHLHGTISVLDTPGLFVPHFKDEAALFRLVLIKAVNPDQQDMVQLSEQLLQFLSERYPSIMKKLGVTDLTLESVAREKKFLTAQGESDLHRAAVFVLSSCRKGKLGRLSFETPDEL
jgi:ribosome biogenesis GTPase A